MVDSSDDTEEWYVAFIDGEVTLVTLGHHAGRGRFSIRKDIRGRSDYRLIDPADIICRATPENSAEIIEALFYRYSK
jgi:hypothetical protein